MAICSECGEEFEAVSIFDTMCEDCEDTLEDEDEEDEDFDDEDE